MPLDVVVTDAAAPPRTAIVAYATTAQPKIIAVETLLGSASPELQLRMFGSQIGSRAAELFTTPNAMPCLQVAAHGQVATRRPVQAQAAALRLRLDIADNRGFAKLSRSS